MKDFFVALPNIGKSKVLILIKGNIKQQLHIDKLLCFSNSFIFYLPLRCFFSTGTCTLKYDGSRDSGNHMCRWQKQNKTYLYHTAGLPSSSRNCTARDCCRSRGRIRGRPCIRRRTAPASHSCTYQVTARDKTSPGAPKLRWSRQNKCAPILLPLSKWQYIGYIYFDFLKSPRVLLRTL